MVEWRRESKRRLTRVLEKFTYLQITLSLKNKLRDLYVFWQFTHACFFKCGAKGWILFNVIYFFFLFYKGNIKSVLETFIMPSL